MEDKPSHDQNGAEHIRSQADIDENEGAEDTDAEKAVEAPSQHHDVLAKEAYSVYTNGQKKALIVAGSFLGLFSPVRHVSHHNQAPSHLTIAVL